MSGHPLGIECEVFCARCEGTFVYVRRRRPRMYCEPCRDAEREDHKISLRRGPRATFGRRIARLA